MDSFDLYAQDSLALTPTLTLNYGAALGRAAAVHAGDQHLVDVDARAICAACRASARGPGGRACNLFQPGMMPAGARSQSRRISSSSRATSRLQHRLEQPRPERRRRLAAATCRSGWLRTILGDPGPGDDARRLLDDASASSAWTASPASTATIPGGTTVRQPQLRHRLPDRARVKRRRCCSAIAAAPRHRRPSMTEPVYPILATPANSVNIFDPNIKTPYVHQSLGRLPAFARPRHGVRGPLRRQPQHERVDDGELERPKRTSSRTGSSTSSRRAQANLRANVAAAGAGSRGFAYTGPGRARRRCRPTSRTSAVPASQADDPARLHRRRTSPTRRGPATSATTSPDPQRRGQRPAREHDVPAERHHRGPAGELLRDEPGRRPRQHHAVAGRHAATTRCRSSCAAGSRSGFLVNGELHLLRTAADRRSQSLRFDRIYLESARTDVPHSFKMQWT